MDKIFETNSSFMWNSAQWGKFNFYFSGVFASILILGGRRRARL